MGKIKSFIDLIAWQKGHRMVLAVYEITGQFPNQEQYALVSQMRRCVVSITSNIAEGFSRKSSKEKNRFYFMALGSLAELQNQLLVARDIGYLEEEKFIRLAKDTVSLNKLINGLIRTSQSYTRY